MSIMTNTIPRTPIEAWPRVTHRGRPGYSARGLNSVSPPAETPLSVAATLEDRAHRERVAVEADRRLAAGDPEILVRAWHDAQFSAAKAEQRYSVLCNSFDAVIAHLEAWAQPAAKPLIRQARAAQRRAGG